MFKQLCSCRSTKTISISSPPAAVLETAPSKLMGIIGMAHCCLLVVWFVVVVGLLVNSCCQLLVTTEMSSNGDGLPASTAVSFPQTNVFFQ
jgi:hypothetical protein